MGKEMDSIPAEAVAAYDRLIASNPDIARKGETTPYTSMNGHMFTFLSSEGEMGLRLSKEDRESFMAEHNTELMEQHGRVMKEFVRVPGGLLFDTSVMTGYLKQSFDYVSGLKPRPTKN